MSKNKKSKKSSKVKSAKNSRSSVSISDNPRYLRRRRVSPLKFTFWLILALLAGFVAYTMYRFIFDKSFDLPVTSAESSKNSSTENSSKAKEKSKKDSEKSSEENPAEKSSAEEPYFKTPTQNDGEDPNVSASLTGSLTSAHTSGNTLVLRVNIDQYLSSGTCSLSLANGNSTFEDSAQIFPTAATSSCEGFDVPLSSLGSGAWNIKINLSSGDRVGEITGSVNL